MDGGTDGPVGNKWRLIKECTIEVLVEELVEEEGSHLLIKEDEP